MLRYYIILVSAVAASALILLLPELAVPRFLLILVVLLILLAVIVYGASSICSGFFVRAICRGLPGSGKVALTFDDGPHPEHSPKILEILTRYGCKASFFVTGAGAQKYPELVTRMAEEGHTVGNHSFSHSNLFPLFRPSRIAREIEETSRILERATGNPARFFRPPFGVTNPRVARGMRNLGLEVAGWSIRSYDTRNTPPEKVVRRITRKMKDGDIILLHETSLYIEEILEGLMEEIGKSGLECVSMDRLLNQQ
jgi:peptidoglycan/xylan/chitin deacetylase (PgdA/CDA1 family)